MNPTTNYGVSAWGGSAENTAAYDASFFQLVHRILSEPEEDDSDRRGKGRNRFAVEQEVGAIVDGRLPRRDDMHKVLCRDLSSGGFSYFSPHVPESDRLLVALSGSSQTLYLSAEVMHCRAIEDGGDQAFLVGCKFIRRLEF